MSWTGGIISLVLYSIVFMALRYDMFIEGAAIMQARPGLLMLILPGAVAALTSKEAPLTVALVAALSGTLLCIFILNFYADMCYDPIQELAFDASAIFWCGCGSLLIMLIRTFFWHSHG
ncbi:inner membrane protein YbjM [Erwinia psidii]|uniref:Uncharacterized protein n=1 Tax=Erwinia psidii TaxID=69224 RepID=A0A3N6SEL0_9GAMM|nr:inner membrane protein YbjM [Erwinia psidii]MCX8957338.1 hypothetical protein [Erwinia psidii]MCX8959708.1 hypothetical protein [Erwinia psidii]MCX8964651.1 hypothetical protein [Erwinia psidii]RQM38343.1 hypothetical protein EB241_10835 [Erwinia psidii]